jgi:RNA polymerase sigma-70 factor (ECF subfamily)
MRLLRAARHERHASSQTKSEGTSMLIADDDQDRSLLAAIARGDQQAFWALWLRHKDRLFGICLREMSGNRVDAEDMHGQAMMRAHQTLPRFASGVRCTASWLARMTINICRDQQRARSRLARAEEQLAQSVRERRRVVAFSSGRAEPLRAAAGWDIDPGSLIAQLPDRLRGVFILRVVQDQSYEAIADQFAITPVTARKRVQEARAWLRALRDQPSHASRADGDAVEVALRSHGS